MTVKKGDLIKDNLAEIQYYSSDGVAESILTNDLSEIFNSLADEFRAKTGEVLIFIDGTNGNLSISPYNSQISETVDDHFVMVELTEFWEDTQNGYDFDEIISSSIKTALRSSTGLSFRQNFAVFIQTELDQPEKLRQNVL